MTMREDIVANALWGVDNEPAIHYSQGSERMAAIMTPRALPLYTDCSGFVTYCYAWAGAPDPNGMGYNGYGYTGTLLNLPHIARDQVQVGDLIVFGPGTGDHVVVVVEEGQDPLCVSHGQEAGPAKVRLSIEASYHRSPVTFLQGIGEEELASSDDILTAINQTRMVAQDADNLAHVAADKAAHVEAMLGSLITALKTAKVIPNS